MFEVLKYWLLVHVRTLFENANFMSMIVLSPVAGFGPKVKFMEPDAMSVSDAWAYRSPVGRLIVMVPS